MGQKRAWVLMSAAAAALALMALAAGGSRKRPAGCPVRLIPAYVGPEEIADLARATGPQLMVLNPASGPGEAPRDGYRRGVRTARRNGSRVLGYVPTSYGARDPAAVEADIERYEAWYGVDGIFLDEAASANAQLAYYGELSRRVRARGERLVVLNPGTVPAQGYFDVADIVVAFEGAYANYGAARARMPAWLDHVPSGRIAVLVYGATREQAAEVLAGAGYAGYAYATSGTLPDPWGTIPSYLDDVQREPSGCADRRARAGRRPPETLAISSVVSRNRALRGNQSDPTSREGGSVSP